MKKLLLAGLLLTGLAGCSKNSEPAPAPAPTLTGGTWTFKSATIATTPKSGGNTTTSTPTLAPGSATVTFIDATHYTTTAAGLTGSGTYTYSANTIDSMPDNGAAVAISPKLTVSELTATKLVLTENSEDATNRYITANTFTR
jgi:hypothetical protein